MSTNQIVNTRYIVLDKALAGSSSKAFSRRVHKHHGKLLATTLRLTSTLKAYRLPFPVQNSWKFDVLASFASI